MGEAVGDAVIVVALHGSSNLEAVEEFSRDEDVERAAPEATSAVSDFEVIKEAVCGDPLVVSVTGLAIVAVAADSNLEVADTL